MYSHFQAPPKKLLITGANGWVGRNAYHILKRNYQLILVDNKAGVDVHNRFGLEGTHVTLALPADQIITLDLVTEREAFAKLIQQEKPVAVLHFAGILENQPLEKIRLNEQLNRNVFEVCATAGVKVIATSSIMVMYGAALNNPKLSRIFNRESIELKPEEKLTVESSLNNTETTIKQFNENSWHETLTYIKTKEAMENLARDLVEKNPKLTFALIRLGWTGVKNPYELEHQSQAVMTEIPVYLDQKDLQNFITKLTEAVLANKITGCKTYICVSNHPQSWVNLDNAERDLDWRPEVNIQEKYGLESQALAKRH